MRRHSKNQPLRPIFFKSAQGVRKTTEVFDQILDSLTYRQVPSNEPSLGAGRYRTLTIQIQMHGARAPKTFWRQKLLRFALKFKFKKRSTTLLLMLKFDLYADKKSTFTIDGKPCARRYRIRDDSMCQVLLFELGVKKKPQKSKKKFCAEGGPPPSPPTHFR